MITCAITHQVQRTDEDQNVNVDDSDDEFEEYEWAGQKRVRASSMLPRDLTSGKCTCCCVHYKALLDLDYQTVLVYVFIFDNLHTAVVANAHGFSSNANIASSLYGVMVLVLFLSPPE